MNRRDTVTRVLTPPVPPLVLLRANPCRAFVGGRS
jgi:hypothetical protein